MDEVMTTEELAKMLKVDERTVQRYVQERSIPFTVLPQRGSRRQIRFLKSQIDRWLLKNSDMAVK